MSDFGLFEADEVAQNEPRRQARTAARQLEAAIGVVRSQFGRFLMGATGIDEFGDRWHYSKADIRAAVEPHVFPATGTMRRIQNAMKADWKLAHPYKLAEDRDAPIQDIDETYHPSDANLIPEGNFEGYKDSVDQDGPAKVQRDFGRGGDTGSDRHARRAGLIPSWEESDLEGYPEDTYPGEFADEPFKPDWKKRFDEHHGRDKEAARLVADIYTDFARSNGLRVASLDTLDAYASTGIHDADYRLLESMIVRAAEDCSEECDDDEDDDFDSEDSDSDSEAPSASEGDDSDSDDDSDEDYDFGGEDAAEDDSEGDESDDSEEPETESGGEDYGFGDADGDGDHDDADHHGGEQFTVPEHAPELPPEMVQEIPQDDPGGSAPVPPEVIDSLLGLPEGTIEQLLLEEVEQGAQGGDPGMGGAPQGGGDDFFGGGGDDAERESPRVARRRRRSARAFWAAEGEQEQESEGGGDSGGGGEQQAAPAQDPAAAMGMNQPMMPPPGSQAVAPPAPPAPMEDQPAEDALLDTANQAIMQMIDRETQEYQQIIDPLSQALQAIQFAQQVEQAEHPMDVTPPEGTVDVSPSAAPGGQAPQPPMQQMAMRRQAKVETALRNAAALIARRYRLSRTGHRMLVQATLGRRGYEHVVEALRLVPPESRKAAAIHMAHLFAAGNQRFNKDIFMRTVMASNPRDRAGDAWRDGRDRGVAEHGRHDLDDHGDDDDSRWLNDADSPLLDDGSLDRAGYPDHLSDDDVVREYVRRKKQEHRNRPPVSPDAPSGVWGGGRELSNAEHQAEMDRIERANRASRRSSRGRLPFDLPRRTAGETWTNTSTMDAFEFPNAGEVPEITDALTVNDLPKMDGGHVSSRAAASQRAVDRFQRWQTRQQQRGLPITQGEAAVHDFLQTSRPHKKRVGPDAANMIHRELGLQPDSVKTPKAKPLKAVNPTLEKAKPGKSPKAAPKASPAPPKSAAAFFLDGPNDDPGADPSRLHCSRCGHSAPGASDDDDVMCPKCPGAVMDYKFYGHPTERLVSDFLENPESDYGDALFEELKHRSSQGDRHAAETVENEVAEYGERGAGGRGKPDPDGQWADQALDAIRHPSNWQRVRPGGEAHGGRPVPKDDYELPFDADPRLNRGLLSNRQASFFTRRVPGWRWDDHLNGYLSKEARAFTCSCGQKVAAPSYKTCGCGKIWNVYAIGDTHHLASDSAEVFIAREIPVRDNVIMASKRLAGADGMEPRGELSWKRTMADRVGHNAWKATLPGGAAFHVVHDPKKNRIQLFGDEGWGKVLIADVDSFDEAHDVAESELDAIRNAPDWSVMREHDHDDDDWRESSLRGGAEKLHQELVATMDRLAGDGMSYEDAMSHIDDVLAEGEGHTLHHVPGTTVSGDIRTESYDFMDCPHCRGNGAEGADLCPTCNGSGAVGTNADSECEACSAVFPDEDLEYISSGDQVCPDCADEISGPVCQSCGERESDGHHPGYPCTGAGVVASRRKADWTKYDDPEDPVAKTYGKPKPPSTRIPKQPKDWTSREFTGPDKGQWREPEGTELPRTKRKKK